MISFPCPAKVDCEGSDFPIENISIEGLDRPIFPCVWTYYHEPALGGGNAADPWCTRIADSYVSNEDACINARREAWECIHGELFENDPITVTVTCP